MADYGMYDSLKSIYDLCGGKVVVDSAFVKDFLHASWNILENLAESDLWLDLRSTVLNKNLNI